MNKYVQTNVKSSYNKSMSESPYRYKVEANINNLESIDNSTVKEALNLFSAYPDAYDAISLGSYEIDGNAQVNVNAYAFAYGITNRISAYIGIPVYDAKVALNYKRKSHNSYQEVADILQSQYGDDWAQTLGNIVENFYDLDAKTIQSGIVNGMGYKEIGNWEGQGLGDIELGVMNNFIHEKNYGLMYTIGAVLPTGYVDDPDIIQDIGFGDGQFDIFVEFGGGKEISQDLFWNAWSRFTYQFASEKTLRLPMSEDVSISSEKGDFEEKLGNKLSITTDLEYFPNDWIKIQPSYIFNYKEKSQYKSKHQEANDILASNTESHSHNLKILGQFSSVKLYKNGIFSIPAQFNISYQQMINGKNTPKTDLLELELRLFF